MTENRSTRSGRWLSGVVGTALGLVMGLGIAAPALAKGPVTLTITGPGIDKTIDLVESGYPELISRLMEQTKLWYGTSELPLDIDPPAGELGPAYVLSWLNSGPPDEPEAARTIVQEVYLEAETGPLVHTSEQQALSGWGVDVIGWFKAPAGLRDTLAELGVPVAASASSGSVPAAGLSAADSADPDQLRLPGDAVEPEGASVAALVETVRESEPARGAPSALRLPIGVLMLAIALGSGAAAALRRRAARVGVERIFDG